jgi:hypothetical protein
MTDPTTPARRGALARLARDPLLHFLVAGGLLFGAYTRFAPEAVPPADPTRIELTIDDMRQLALVQLAQAGRCRTQPPSARWPSRRRCSASSPGKL